jgi:hypothetical protein
MVVAGRRMALSVTPATLRETSFPPAFAKWLKGLQELPASDQAWRKTDGFSTI